MDKAYIKLWLDYRCYFETLSDAEVGRLVRAMLDYEIDGAAPEFSGSERILWPVMRRNLDIDHEFLEKQSKNGAKGGRPKKSKETQQNPDKPKETQQNQTKPNIENRKKIIEDISFVSNDTQDICNAESVATRKRAPAYSAKKAIEDYTRDPELRELLLEWLDNRKKQRAPETKGAIGRNLDVLAELAAQSNMSLQDYMREIVRRGWIKFFPIRENAQQNVQDDGRGFDWVTGR